MRTPLGFTKAKGYGKDHAHEAVGTGQRLDPCCDYDRHAVWHAASGALRGYLAQQSLPNVHVGLDKHGPLNDRRSGKLREVIVAMERSPAHA